MADRKISELTELAAPSISAAIPVVQDGQNYKATAENIVKEVLSNSGSLPPLQSHGSTHETNGSDPAGITFFSVPVLTGDTNDLLPTAKADVVLLSSSAPVLVTGINAGYGPKALLLINTGGHDITLPNNAGSAAANRFLTLNGDSAVLAPQGGSASVVYDATAAINGRWRVLGTEASGGVSDWADIQNKPSQFPPTTHASTHAEAGTDPLTLAQSQVSGLTAALADKSNVNHGHGNILSGGTLGSVAGVPLITGAGGLIETGAFGSSPGSFCAGDDSRLSDSRTPSAHAASHAAAGSDPVTIAQSQVTNLTSDLAGKASASALTAHTSATTSVHGIADTSLLVVTSDSRLSDARTPLPHSHGNIANNGTVGSAENKPLITGSLGLVQAGEFGAAANTFCQGNDSRLSDARTPTLHGSTHQTGQADPIGFVIVNDLLLADTNDWVPSGAADIIQVAASGTFSVTGISAAYSPKAFVLTNIQVNDITLVHASPLSLAGNRFLCADEINYVLRAGTSCTVYYDASTGDGVWRVAESNPPPYSLPVASSSTLGGIKVGSNLAITAGGTLSVAPGVGTGTVQSVDISGGTTGLTASGGPITGSGTITLGGVVAVAAGGTGASSEADARSNLGLGTIATAAANDYVPVTGGTFQGKVNIDVAIDPSTEVTQRLTSPAVNGAVVWEMVGNGGATQTRQLRFVNNTLGAATVWRRMRGTAEAPVILRAGDRFGGVNSATWVSSDTTGPVSTPAQWLTEVLQDYQPGDATLRTRSVFFVSSGPTERGTSVAFEPTGVVLRPESGTPNDVTVVNQTNVATDHGLVVQRSRTGGAATASNDVLGAFICTGTGATSLPFVGGSVRVRQLGAAQSSGGTDCAVDLLAGTSNQPTDALTVFSASASGIIAPLVNSPATLQMFFGVRAVAAYNAAANAYFFQQGMVITKTALGNYTVTLNSPMPDASYSVLTHANANANPIIAGWATGIEINTQTQNGFNVRVRYTNENLVQAYDPTYLTLAVVR